LKRVAVAFSLVATAASLVACNAILGLQEPVVDDTINGDADKPDGVVPGDAGDGGPQQLVAHRTNHIALDNDNVYYTAAIENLVARVSKDGTSTLDLANGVNATYFAPYELQIDATDVFWTSGASILQCKKTGCNNAPTHVVDENAADAGSYDIEAYAPDDMQTIYFDSYDSGLDENTIFSVPKGVENAPVTKIVDPASLAFCPTVGQLYYVTGALYVLCEEGPIARIDPSTHVVETITSASAPSSAEYMVVGGSQIYYTQFTSTGSVFSLPATPASDSTPIALDQVNPDRIDIDQQYLYWTVFGSLNDDAAVVRCKLGSCSTTITPIASKLDTVIDVKTDGTAIYYSVPGNGDSPTNGIYKVVMP
jgi:hypothetical protein